MSDQLATADACAFRTPEIKQGGRPARFLAQSVVLEEAGGSRLARAVIFTIGALVVTSLAWAGLTEVKEVAVTAGKVAPSGRVQVVQHLEGGIIRDILVRDGQSVNKDAVMVRLDPSQALTELNQTKVRRAGLLLRAERLRALGTGRDPDFSIAGSGYDGLVAGQSNIYEGQLDAKAGRRAVLLIQVEQRWAELSRLADEEDKQVRTAEILAEELQLRDKLLRQGLTSKITYLNAKRAVSQARGELARLAGERERSREALAEAQKRLEELDSDLREQALEELSEVTVELAQVNESLRRLEDRVERLDIRSPVDGVVNALIANTIGGVIPAGGVVLEVAPAGEELIVETRVSPRDAGHVFVGQPVSVKVTAFDFARFGDIQGELREISATTFADKDGKPFYKAKVALSQNFAGTDPARNIVKPGMTVRADILTGSKTLLEYLLKPVAAPAQNTFRER